MNTEPNNPLLQRYAMDVYPETARADVMNGFEKAHAFHTAFELPVRDDWTDSIPVGERLLRGQLLIEEVLETINAMGLRLKIVERDASDPNNWERPDSETSIPKDGFQYLSDSDVLAGFEVEHVEGSLYDPVETADGLADIKVICNGTAVAFGIPMDEVDLEVFCSNMTKLDENGKPIVNECIVPGCMSGAEGLCADSHLLDPSKPLGKVLKPATYTPANIKGLRESFLADRPF